MNHSNYKIALKLMLPLFLLLAGCSFPTDGETQGTPTPSSTPTSLPTATTTSTPTSTENVVPTPTQVTPTSSLNAEQATESPSNPGENPVITPTVDGSVQQPFVTAIAIESNVPDPNEPSYTESTPEPMTPAESDPVDSENQPNDHQSSEDTASPAENEETSSAMDAPAQQPSPDGIVVVPGIILDLGEPYTGKPTPCGFCTAD